MSVGLPIFLVPTVTSSAVSGSCLGTQGINLGVILYSGLFAPWSGICAHLNNTRRVQATMPRIFAYVYALLATPWLLSRLLADISISFFPWARPTQEWSLNQAVRVRVVQLALLYLSILRLGDRLSLKPGSEGNRFEVLRPRSSKLYKGPASDAQIRPQLLGVTWTPARPPPPSIVGEETTVVLHFHGGAFVIGNGRDNDTGYLARTLIRHLGCTHVCTPQYRLSSSRGGRFPAPLQDAITAYSHLLHGSGIPASQIILSGDSAGGNLALGLLRYIEEHDEDDLPLPGAVSLWSPWVDVGAALKGDVKSSPNFATDYLNGHFSRWGSSTISATVDASGPYLSPLHHPFRLGRRIPVFIHGGEREVLQDDIRKFCRLYEEQGWLLHLVMSPGCPHDVLLLGPRMGFHQEAERAVREMRGFLLSTSSTYLRV